MVTVAWFCPVCPCRHTITAGLAAAAVLSRVLAPLPVPARTEGL